MYFSKCKASLFFLSVSTIFLVSLAIYLSIPVQTASLKEPLYYKNVCLTPKCVHWAATILKHLDQNVDPCDNFYKFVCGNFIKNTVIPEDKTVVKTVTLVNDKIKLQLKHLVDQPIHPTDLKSLRLLKTMYKSCMNTSRIESEALPFMKKILNGLGGWPVTEPNWNERKFDWKQALYRLRRMGWNFNIFMQIYVNTDMKNSSRRILTITQPYISDIHILIKGINHNDTRAYYDYMVNVATYFGASELSAIVEMKEVLEFEINLSKITIPYTLRYNLSSEYNPTTIKQLQESFYTIPWLQLINNFLAPQEMLTSEDVVNVAMPKYFKHLEELLLNTDKRILANYIMWYIVKSSVMHLPQKVKDQAEKYLKKGKGVERLERRWEQCVKEMDKLHIATSSVYIKNFFNQKDKSAVAEIAYYIKEAFIENLMEIQWMDLETRARALLKAEKMNFLIAFPDELLEENSVEDYYREVTISPSSHYLKIILHVSAFLHRKHVEGLRKSNDWTRSYARSYRANGFYNQQINTVEVMAALMHDHFFDSERPQYMNFGSIGEVIGHEITHGFDDEGKQYDENGNLANWWAPQTLNTFTQKSECFINQYNNLTIPEIGMNVNGVNTFDENIADNGGYKIAYNGYLTWIKRNKEEPLLPGVPFTQKQLFWISAASDACAVYKKEALKRFVRSGRHAPEFSRVLVPFMNADDFANDFKCSVGTGMNPNGRKCKLW